MTEHDDGLAREVGRRAARHRAWQREGEDSLARRLGQIGVLGWIIVLPMLGGIWLGRRLDAAWHTGLTLTGALLVLGLALGAWSGWKWMHAT